MQFTSTFLPSLGFDFAVQPLPVAELPVNPLERCTSCCVCVCRNMYHVDVYKCIVDLRI